MLNKVTLIGRLGKDPEIRNFDNGTIVCKFTFATSKKFVDKNGQSQERTQWHNIVFYRKQAEIIYKYAKKGDMLYIGGEIETRKYEDKKGQTQYITEIIGNDFVFLKNEKKAENNNTEQVDNTSNINGGDLPF